MSHADNSPRPQIETGPFESFVGMLQELPYQNVVYGVQGLQVRSQYDEWGPRDRSLYAGSVGDDTSGRMRSEPLHRRQRSARQGFLHVRLQLRSKVGIMLNNWRTTSIARTVKRIELEKRIDSLSCISRKASSGCLYQMHSSTEKENAFPDMLFFFPFWERSWVYLLYEFIFHIITHVSRTHRLYINVNKCQNVWGYHFFAGFA